jgi:hypothetical protein
MMENESIKIIIFRQNDDNSNHRRVFREADNNRA